MQNAEILNAFSLFYYRSSPEDWRELADPTTWQDFLTSIGGKRDERNSETITTTRVPDCLAELPVYEAFRSFADCHFTGGLSTSILAVESLYRTWTASPEADLIFANQHGFYDSDSAAHMRFLYASLGIELAPDGVLPADHLALLLSFLALLIENAPAADIQAFIDEHLNWLPELLEIIRQRAPEAAWLAAITELLIRYLQCLSPKTAMDPTQAANILTNAEVGARNSQ